MVIIHRRGKINIFLSKAKAVGQTCIDVENGHVPEIHSCKIRTSRKVRRKKNSCASVCFSLYYFVGLEARQVMLNMPWN